MDKRTPKKVVLKTFENFAHLLRVSCHICPTSE